MCTIYMLHMERPGDETTMNIPYVLMYIRTYMYMASFILCGNLGTRLGSAAVSQAHESVFGTCVKCCRICDHSGEAPTRREVRVRLHWAVWQRSLQVIICYSHLRKVTL